MLDFSSLGIMVTKHREKLNLTQKELARIIGVSQSSISSLEKGRTQNISIVKLDKIATALNTTLDELLFDSIDKFKWNTTPKSLSKLHLWEMIPLLTDTQISVFNDFYEYKLKLIEEGYFHETES